MSYNHQRDIDKAYAEPSYKEFADMYYMPEDNQDKASANLKQQQADINNMVPEEFFDFVAYHTKDEYHVMVAGIADYYRLNRYLTQRQFHAICKATLMLGLEVPSEAYDIRLE